MLAVSLGVLHMFTHYLATPDRLTIAIPVCPSFPLPCCLSISSLFPLHLVRYDPGVIVSAIARYLPALATGGSDAMKLSGPFSKVLETAWVGFFTLQSKVNGHT